MNRALFIGLGGAGVSTMGHVKAKFLLRSGNNPEELAKRCRFIFVDTDSMDLESVQKEYSARLGAAGWLTNQGSVSMGHVNPYDTYYRVSATSSPSSADRRFLEWIDTQGARSLANAPMERGAGANRQQGRIGLWAQWPAVQNEVTSALKALTGDGQPNDGTVTVYLASGTCGGTGSSLFLDVSNLVHRVWRETFAGSMGDPDIVGILYMPHTFIEIYRAHGASERTLARYASNAYGFFTEMEGFLEDRWAGKPRAGQSFDALSVRPLGVENKGAFSVFKYAFCVDSVTEAGATTEQYQMYRNAAEALYHWVSGLIEQKVSTATINALSGDYAAERSRGTVPAFAVLGYRALRYPEELMDRYFHRRFAFELFQGVAGQELSTIFSERYERDAYLKKLFDQQLRAVIFSDSGFKQDTVPNLERDAGALAYAGLDLPSGIFLNEKGKFDKAKAKNKDVLDAFIEGAQLLQDAKVRQLDAGFRSGPWSCEALVAAVKRTLGAEVEAIILRWGLRAAREVLDGLDILCQQTIATPTPDDDLDERLQKLQEESHAMEVEIETAKKECLSNGGEKHVTALQNLLVDKVKKTLARWILLKQKQVLELLSQGENGLLDEWRRRLDAVVRAFQVELQGSGEEKGLESLYRSELPKEFMMAERDVTTTFLPRVAAFVHEGSWASSHLFAQLYEKLVPQETIAGTSRPVRFGADHGMNADIQGLQKLLAGMLASPAATRMPAGYQCEDGIHFFRKAFLATPPEWEPLRLVNELAEIAKAHLMDLAAKDQNISQERQRNLLERFNGLSEADQKDIRGKFSAAGVQAFAPMINHEAQVHLLYCGQEEQLARKLGYKETNGNMTWLSDGSPNSLVLVKAGFRYTLRDDNSYDTYKSTYLAEKQDSETTGTSFVPHIDGRFTRWGIAPTIRQLAATGLTDDERIRLYGLALLYREFAANARGRVLLGAKLDLDPRYLGAEQREASPLLIEKDTTTGKNHAWALMGMEAGVGKRVFQRQNYTYVGEVKNHAQGLHILSAHPFFWPSVEEYDEWIRRQGDESWVATLKSASDAVVKKLETNIQDLQKINSSLTSSILAETDEIIKTLSTRTATAPSEGKAGAAVTPPDAVDTNL
jgi:hypothetical protein